jgi:hypothetical protein
MQTLKAAELVEDFSLYPRSQVDGAHVSGLVHALEAGETLPPVIVDQDSKRIVDGFHRRRATLRAFGDDADIQCDVKRYACEKDMYIDAMRLNSRHGKSITGAERTGAVLKAHTFKIKLNTIAASLGVTTTRVEKILQTKVASVRNGKKNRPRRIALKRCVSHLAGKTITRAQADAMDSLPGQPQSLLIQQLITLLETSSINMEDERVVSGLHKLRDVLAPMDLNS